MADWYVSSAAWTAIPQFAASGVYTVGNIVRPLTAPAFNAQYAFRCTTAGTASTEPAWNASNNGTVTTGGATFTNVSGQSAYGWAAAAGNIWCLTSNSPTGTPRFVIGDRIFLSSDHSETNTASFPNYALPNNGGAFAVVQIISVNRAGSVPPVAADALSGATIIYNNSNSLTFATGAYWQGVTMNCGGTGGAVVLGDGGSKTIYLKNCALLLSTSNTGATIQCATGCKAVLDNTTVQFNNANQRIQPSGASSDVQWINTPAAILGTIPNVLLTAGTNQAAQVTLRGVDLSALTTTLLYTANNTGAFGKTLLDSCRIAAGLVRLSATSYNNSADEVELVNCYDGTSFVSERHTPAGDVTTEFTITLSGGAQDNVGLFSHKMISSTRSDKYAMPLDGFWLDTNYATIGSSKTATVEIVSNVTLNNDDIVLWLEYEGTAGSSLASFANSQGSPLTPVAAVPTSTATWSSLPVLGATWNAMDSVNVTLTGSNLIATGTGQGGVRGTVGLTSGKNYWETTLNTFVNSSTGVGASGAAWVLANANTSSNFAAFLSPSGPIWVNGSNLGTLGARSNGDIIAVALDVGAQLIWFRVAPAGNWNGSGTANPATGAGGFSVTALGSTVFPTFGPGANNERVTANFGTSGFSGTVPVGFSGIPALPSVRQRLQTTFTPLTVGRVRAQVRLGKPFTTVYVNPQITVT